MFGWRFVFIEAAFLRRLFFLDHDLHITTRCCGYVCPTTREYGLTRISHFADNVRRFNTRFVSFPVNRKPLLYSWRFCPPCFDEKVIKVDI